MTKFIDVGFEGCDRPRPNNLQYFSPTQAEYRLDTKNSIRTIKRDRLNSKNQ